MLHSLRQKVSINVLSPAPGNPVMPMRILFPTCGQALCNSCCPACLSRFELLSNNLIPRPSSSQDLATILSVISFSRFEILSNNVIPRARSSRDPAKIFSVSSSMGICFFFFTNRRLEDELIPSCEEWMPSITCMALSLFPASFLSVIQPLPHNQDD